MLYYLHKFDIYILGLLLVILSTIMYFDHPSLYSTVNAGEVLLAYLALYMYTRAWGTRWYTFHEDFRVALEEALEDTLPNDFVPASYFDFLMPRLLEVRKPGRSLHKANYVSTEPVDLLMYGKVKSLNVVEDKLYMHFVVKFPKAFSLKTYALGLFLTTPYTGRPYLLLPSKVNKNEGVKITLYLYLGKFNSNSSNISYVYSLKLLKKVLESCDTSIYPL
jgi:hypothetical protein